MGDLRQADVDTYLADAPPSRYRVRDSAWIAGRDHDPLANLRGVFR